MAIRVEEAASVRLDEIYRYALDTWGEVQAETYIIGLFSAFEQIETRGVHSRAVPAEFAVEGLFLLVRAAYRVLEGPVEWRYQHRHHPSRADAAH